LSNIVGDDRSNVNDELAGRPWIHLPLLAAYEEV